MKKVLGCCALVIVAFISNAQTRYIVQLKNKGNNPYSLSNPSAFLTQRAITRRTRYSIALDSADLPITPGYVDSIRLSGNVTILNISKWLNSVSIQTTDAAALNKINSFPFVQSVTGIAARMMNSNQQPSNKFIEEQNLNSDPQHKQTNIISGFFDYGSSYAQIHIHNGEFLHHIGLQGQGMMLGLLDAGFNNYLTVNAFDSVRLNGQIFGVYDFVAKDSSVNEDNAHGEEVFSTIAANMPGQFVGSAPKASFYLFRTEDASTEYPVEEHNWVCGAERVDSLGGDVISTSLGYTTFDAPLTALSHTYADMNGNTTMAAIGADLAAKKGILVAVAAENDGTGSWHYISTPADADSAMTVGAVNASGSVASFSSYGPSSDGQIKPDVASVGASAYVVRPDNTIIPNNGTSFATPNIAGLTTCLWQGFPEFSNMKIINALRQAGSKASAPDDRVGYGIPDVKKALLILLKDFTTSSAIVGNCQATITWTSKDVSSMKYEIEKMLPGQNSFTKVGTQAGSGNTFGTGPSYQFQDNLNGASAGTITYRIREIIDTASSTFTADYIDTATVSLTSSCTTPGVVPVNNDNEIMLLPNPAKEHFTIKITTATAIQNLVIRIFNGKGQEAAGYNKNKNPGTATFDISITNLTAGKYYISIYNGNQLMATKELIKL